MPKSQNEIIYLEIEKSRVNREKSKAVLDKSFIFYITFLVIGVIGFSSGHIDSKMLSTLVVFGIIILLIGTLPYIIITSKEDQFLKKKLEELRK